jgi:hypothetical protein
MGVRMADDFGQDPDNPNTLYPIVDYETPTLANLGQ